VEAGATTIVYHPGMDQQIQAMGPNGLIVYANNSSVRSVRHDNGWMVQECTLTGEVVKGNSQYPEGPNQSVVFRLLPIQGMFPCSNGLQGLFMIFGKGSLGLQSFVPQGDYQVTEQEGQLLTARPLMIKNSSLRGKFLEAQPRMKNLILESVPAAGAPVQGAAVSPSDLKETAKFLSNQIYPK
jgi:hypothetical protein